MKTRSKPARKARLADSEPVRPAKTLPDPDPNPFRMFILPKGTTEQAAIVRITSPGTGTVDRYLVCPRKGFYQITRVAAPKSKPRSWLLTPSPPHRPRSADQTPHEPTSGTKGADAAGSASSSRKAEAAPASSSMGYISADRDLYVATPFDALFLLLPILAPNPKGVKAPPKQLFLSCDDYFDCLATSAPEIKYSLRYEGILRQLEERLACMCDCVDAGDEKMYRLSMDKLVGELVGKARRMIAAELPHTLRARFVLNALKTPIMPVKRDESKKSDTRVCGIESQTSQPLQPVADTATPTNSTATDVSLAFSESQASASTDATSIPPNPSSQDAEVGCSQISVPKDVLELGELRVALDFMFKSYLPPHLRDGVNAVLSKGNHIDFTPLNAHLDYLASLGSQAQALRSLSDNISRKRSAEEDEEISAAREEKKRKKEEGETKKKMESHAVRALRKVDTSGMKKMSSFFSKAPAKK